MTSRLTIWRIESASLAPALRDDEVTVSYDDRGISLVTHTDPSALIVPWRGCQLRLTRRSTTWELRMRDTPWGTLTLVAFRPQISDEFIEDLESRGVVWVRWRWTKVSTLVVVLLGLTLTAITLYAEAQSPLTRIAKVVPGPNDFGFHVIYSPESPPFAAPKEGTGFAFMPRSNQPDIARYVTPSRWRRLRRAYLACAGTSLQHDALWGTDRVTPEAQITTPTYLSVTNPEFRVAVTATWLRDTNDMRAMQHQLDSRRVVPCMTSTLAKFATGGAIGKISPARPVTVQSGSTSHVIAAVANTRRDGTPLQLFTAVVTSDHVTATLVVLAPRGADGESRFRSVVSFLAQSIAGQRLAAV